MTETAKHKIHVIGRREFVNIPALDISGIEAKIDTGAYTSSLHCEKINVCEEESGQVLCFTIEPGDQSKEFRFKDFAQKKIKNSFGEMEERYVIKTVVNIGKKKIRSIISLSNRDNMRYPLLIGRRLLKAKFLIDVSLTHTGGIGLKRAFREYQSKNTFR
jgi:hypothetical protein